MSAAHDKVVVFGSFEADIASGELRKGGLRLKIPEQSFRVLEALLAEPGEIVSRESLQHLLWSPDTHVAFEQNLNTIVHTLRAALGDSAKNPRFIETVHGKGYRWLSPVKTAPKASPRQTETTPRRLGSGWGLRLVIISAGIAAIFWLASWPTQSFSPPTEPTLPMPVTSYVGMESSPSYAPDGSIAFQWDGGNNNGFDIYQKRIGSESVTRLTHDDADETNPAWSPDGRTLAFLRRLPGYKAAIVLAPMPYGDERVLASIDTSQTSLSWSADGRWIVYSNDYPDYLRRKASGAGVLAIEVSTGRSVHVTIPEPPMQGDSFPALSPRGGLLSFVRGYSEATGDIYVLEVDSEMRAIGSPRRVTFDATSFQSLAWSPDGNELFFVSNRAKQSSLSTLWRLPLEAGVRRDPIPLGSSNALDVAVSPTEGLVVFSSLIESHNLWRLDLADLRPKKPAERITLSTSVNRGPSLSPDGDRIAFESNRSGVREIWVSGADGSDPRKVSSFGGPNSGTPQWSPDGRRLAVDSRVEGYGDIFVIDVDDGSRKRLTESEGDDIVPSWSHDGNWIYFASNRTGRYEIWKAPALGGQGVQVTHGGGFHAREAVNGKTLYYAKSITQTSLWKTPVQGGEERQVIDALGEWSNFVPTRDGIFYFAPPADRRTALRFFDFTSGVTRSIYEVDAALNGGLAARMDGTAVIFSRPEPAQSDLMAMKLSPRAQQASLP